MVMAFSIARYFFLIQVVSDIKHSLIKRILKISSKILNCLQFFLKFDLNVVEGMSIFKYMPLIGKTTAGGPLKLSIVVLMIKLQIFKEESLVV